MEKVILRADLARLFQRSPRWISKLVDQGMPREIGGGYDVAKCMWWYIRHLQRELERRELTPDDVPLRRERLRLVTAQADREEYELKQRRAQLAPAEVLAEFERGICDRITRAALAMVDDLAPQLEGLNRRTIRVKVDFAVRDMLTRLSKSEASGSPIDGQAS